MDSRLDTGCPWEGWEGLMEGVAAGFVEGFLSSSERVDGSGAFELSPSGLGGGGLPSVRLRWAWWQYAPRYRSEEKALSPD